MLAAARGLAGAPVGPKTPAVREGDGAARPSDWISTAAGAHLRGRAMENTAPEVRLRSTLHARGLRFRLGRKVGRFRPDITFPNGRVAVFVDGCFWHACPQHGAKDFRGPNADRWRAKLAANQTRDSQSREELAALNWLVVRLWECEVRRDVESASNLVAQVIANRRRFPPDG